MPLPIRRDAKGNVFLGNVALTKSKPGTFSRVVTGLSISVPRVVMGQVLGGQGPTLPPPGQLTPTTAGGNMTPLNPVTYGFPLPGGNPLTQGGGSGLPGSGASSGAGVLSGPTCSVLQSLGFPCTTAGAIEALKAGFNLATGGGGGSSGGASQCTPPMVLNRQNGVCEFPGSPGDISTPGGPTGTAVMGMFGAPAVSPIIVGEIKNRPIRQCPRGTVLGMDELCYAKGSIPRKYRKWKPARKAPVTAADARAIRMAESAKGRVKRLAGAVGFTCKKR